jgi:hypothetical protein
MKVNIIKQKPQMVLARVKLLNLARVDSKETLYLEMRSSTEESNRRVSQAIFSVRVKGRP